MTAAGNDPKTPENLVLITVESDDPQRRYDHVEPTLKEHGNPCYVMLQTWVINTNKPPQDLFRVLEFVFQPDDRFIVAPLKGPWSCQKAKSKDECFRDA